MSNNYREIVSEQLERELDFYIMNKIEKETKEKEKWLSGSDVVDVIYSVVNKWKKRAKLK